MVPYHFFRYLHCNFTILPTSVFISPAYPKLKPLLHFLPFPFKSHAFFFSCLSTAPPPIRIPFIFLVSAVAPIYKLMRFGARCCK